MSMPAAHADWTVEMLDALPDDGQRYEIIDGVLYVTPAPLPVHQLVAAEFHRRLDDYLRPAKLARAMFSPLDVRSGDRTRNRVQPDVFAVRLVNGKQPPYPYELSDLWLAIEVESPSNRKYDHEAKRELYLSRGVREYWIASAEHRVVTRWRGLDDPGSLLADRIEWHPSAMPAPLVIDLPKLFADALD